MKRSALSIDDLLSSRPVHRLGADVRFQILFPSADRKGLRDWFGRDLTDAALLTFRLGPSVRQLDGRIEYVSPSRPVCVQQAFLCVGHDPDRDNIVIVHFPTAQPLAGNVELYAELRYAEGRTESQHISLKA